MSMFEVSQHPHTGEYAVMDAMRGGILHIKRPDGFYSAVTNDLELAEQWANQANEMYAKLNAPFDMGERFAIPHE